MSALQTALDEYLAVRRALGVKLRLPGRLLQRFVAFAEREGETFITTELALRWATQPADAQPARIGRCTSLTFFADLAELANQQLASLELEYWPQGRSDQT